MLRHFFGHAWDGLKGESNVEPTLVRPMVSPLVMAVDDDPVIHQLLEFSLAGEFDLHCFFSAEEALMQFDVLLPDLLVLDIGLPGMDGYAACAEFLAQYSVPVIFLSAHDTLEERLRAFDAGACDFMVKPVAPELVLRKCLIAVSQLQKERQLQNRNAELQASALAFLCDVAQSRALLDFVARGLKCLSLAELGQCILETTAAYSLNCLLRLRGDGKPLSFGIQGNASQLEMSVLDNLESSGRIFGFRDRLAINDDKLSLVVTNLPADPVQRGRIQDNLMLLVEAASQIVEMLIVRAESARRAESIQHAQYQAHTAISGLRERYRNQQIDTRILLQELISAIEGAYFSLGLTDAQEFQVSTILRDRSEKILTLFEQGIEFDHAFSSVLASLVPAEREAAAFLF